MMELNLSNSSSFMGFVGEDDLGKNLGPALQSARCAFRKFDTNQNHQLAFFGTGQPLPLPAGTGYHDGVFCLFHGEISNQKEISEAGNFPDLKEHNQCAELCCHLFRNHGPEFAKQMNGLFSIVIIDEKSGQTVLLADKYGAAHPVFYDLDHGLRFSNRIKNFIGLSTNSPSISTEGISLFLKYSYIPSPGTILSGVKKLGPGEGLVYENGQARTFRYHDFLNQIGCKNIDDSVGQYIDNMECSLKNGTRDYPDDRIGFFLSGGLDSTANVAMAHRSGLKTIKTYGIGFADPNIDERPAAKLVADHFGAQFEGYEFDGTEIEDLPDIIWHCDQPFMENGLFLTYAAYRLAAPHVDLVVAGDGADQIFGTGGFAGGRPVALRYLLDKFSLRGAADFIRKPIFGGSFHQDNALFKIKVLLDRSLDFNDWYFWGFDHWEQKKLCRFPVKRRHLEPFSNQIQGLNFSLAGVYDFATVRQDIEHYVCQNVLVKSARIAEMFNIHLREPFLDDCVVDVVLSLDQQMRSKGGVTDLLKAERVSKYAHRLAIDDIMPKEIMQRGKQGGCIPMSILLGNKQLRDSLRERLAESDFVAEYFHLETVEKLFDECDRLYNSPLGWDAYFDCRVSQVMNLLAITLWHDLVFKGDPVSAPGVGLKEWLGK